MSERLIPSLFLLGVFAFGNRFTRWVKKVVRKMALCLYLELKLKLVQNLDLNV